MDWSRVIRWVHAISAAAWLVEVVVINALLVPSLKSLLAQNRGTFIAKVFPRLFRLTSILALTALSSGLAMSYIVTEWRNLDIILPTRWGLGILVGGTLGLLLASFHFVVESRLRPIATSLEEDPSPEEIEQVMEFLRIVTRVGMVVIFAAFLLMMVAAHS